MALTTWQAYQAAAYQAEQVNKHMWLAKGIGTDDLYVVEVDPTSGGFPITFAGAQGFGDPTVGLRTASIPGNASGISDFDIGALSAQSQRVAAGIFQPNGDPYDTNAGAAGTDTLRVVLATGGAGLVLNQDQDWGPVGPSTLRTAAIVGNESGLADFGAGNASAQTLRAVLATDQSAIPVSQSGAPWSVDATNFPAAVDTNTGAPGASTLRAVISSRSEAAVTPLATRQSNGTSFADYGVGASSSTTFRVSANILNDGVAFNIGAGTGGTNTIRAVIDTRSEAVATPLAARLSNGTAFLATGTGADGTDVLRATLSTRAETASTPLATRASNGTSFADYGAGTTGTTTPRISANITRNGTELSYNAGTSDANTLRTAANLYNNGTALSYNTGAADANTLRVTPANESNPKYGRTPVDALFNAYSGLTTSYSSALTLDSGGTTLASDVNEIEIFDDSGAFLLLTWGNASPGVTNTIRIEPGGPGLIPVRIPSGSNIKIKTQSGTATGNLQVNFFN